MRSVFSSILSCSAISAWVMPKAAAFSGQRSAHIRRSLPAPHRAAKGRAHEKRDAKSRNVLDEGALGIGRHIFRPIQNPKPSQQTKCTSIWMI